jgi:hypothetical protein
VAEPVQESFIVVGVSAGSGSPTALRWAADEAARRDCALIAVRAWRPPRPPSAAAGKPPVVTRDPEAEFAEAEEKLRGDVVAALGEDQDVRCVLIKGSAVTVLLKESADATLLVLDAPRRGNIKATTLLAHRLVYNVACPVVVMPPSLTKPEPGVVAKAGKQLGSKLAKAAATAGRPGLRMPPVPG